MNNMEQKKQTPQVRFKGYTDTWEQRKLGEVVDVYDGVHQTPDYTDKGIMFLSVENISTLKSENIYLKKPSTVTTKYIQKKAIF